MADIVNLKNVRKNKARKDAAKNADANRAAYGRTKADKSLTKALKDKAARDLDGHKREGED